MKTVVSAFGRHENSDVSVFVRHEGFGRHEDSDVGSFGRPFFNYDFFGVHYALHVGTYLDINYCTTYFLSLKMFSIQIRGKGLDMALVTKDYELIKWVGANAYRTSHYPYAEEIMDFADQQGIMIINECPAVDIE